MTTKRDCFYYIILQTYYVGLRSRRHPPMEFDAGTRPFASFEAPLTHTNPKVMCRTEGHSDAGKACYIRAQIRA